MKNREYPNHQCYFYSFFQKIEKIRPRHVNTWCERFDEEQMRIIEEEKGEVLDEEEEKEEASEEIEVFEQDERGLISTP